MREVFPHLPSDNLEYDRRRRAMTRLRIIGRRYQALVDKFGQSVLCFLQPCSLTAELDKGVSDNMYVLCGIKGNMEETDILKDLRLE